MASADEWRVSSTNKRGIRNPLFRFFLKIIFEMYSKQTKYLPELLTEAKKQEQRLDPEKDVDNHI